MDNGFLFRIKLRDKELYLNMYGNIENAFDDIMNLGYNDQFTLKVQINNYLSLENNKELCIANFIIFDTGCEDVISVVLSYCNGRLCSVSFSSNKLINIERNLVIYDTVNNSELIRNRLNLLYMLINNVIDEESIYSDKYMEYTELLSIRRLPVGTEYKYILEDDTVLNNYEYMRTSTNTFYKSSNTSELEYVVKDSDENIMINVEELRKILGEYNE